MNLRFRAVLGLLATFAFGLPPAQAAVTEAWVHRYNGGEVVVVGADDRAAKVVRDAASDIIVTGYTENPTIRHEMLTITNFNFDHYTAEYTPASGLIEYHDLNPPPRQAFYRTAQP